eukprot:scaffold25_cov342-Pavlova_lutheri.AAC.17
MGLFLRTTSASVARRGQSWPLLHLALLRTSTFLRRLPAGLDSTRRVRPLFRRIASTLCRPWVLRVRRRQPLGYVLVHVPGSILAVRPVFDRCTGKPSRTTRPATRDVA